MSSGPEWVAVGRMTRAHGVKGEVAVMVLSEVPDRFEPGSKLFVGEREDRSLTVQSSRPHRNRLLVRFDEVDDRDQAEALVGSYLFVPASLAPELPEGEFWSHQLIGCEVMTAAGRSLGPIKEVIHTTANDVWVTGLDEGDDVLIPALKDTVQRVDLQERVVIVRDVPGLTGP